MQTYAYASQQPKQVSLDVSHGLQTTDIEVIAGEVLRVEAIGEYIVSSWDKTVISPAGYPTEKKSYNLDLRPLDVGPHGAAIMIISADETAINGFLVGKCLTAVSPFSGILSLGVNDRETDNNSGSVQFTIHRIPPNSEQASLPCLR